MSRLLSRSLESPENRRVTQDLVRLHSLMNESSKASKTSKDTQPPMNIFEMENLLIQVLPAQHSLRQHLEQQRSSSRVPSPTFREPIRAGPGRRSSHPSTYVEMKEIAKQPVSPSLPRFSADVPPLAVKPRVIDGSRRRQVMSPELVDDMMSRIERAKQMMNKFGSRKQKRGKKSRKRVARK